MVARKQILTGLGISLAAITGILAFQFYRLKNFDLTIAGIDKLMVAMSRITFDVYLNFVNKSDLQIAMAYQTYEVYINNKLVTTLTSKDAQVIAPKGRTTLKFSVDLSPADLIKKLGASSLTNLLTFKQQVLKIDAKLGLKFLFSTIPVHTVIEDKIVNWAKPSK